MKNEYIAKAIIQEILHEGLKDSSWRDRYPEAYDCLVANHTEDLRSSALEILKLFN